MQVGSRQLAVGKGAITILMVALLFSCNQKTEKKTGDFGSGGPSKFSDTAASYVRVYDENGRLCIQQSNTYYELIDFYKGSKKIPLLLKINKTEICVADSVNQHKVYKISAKSVSDKENIGWETDFTGTQIEFKDNTLLVTHSGVEQEEDYLRRFSLQDGKEVFACSISDLKLKIPNVRDRRFMGFTSQNTADEPLKAMDEENLLGIIQYSSGTQSIDKVKLKLKRSKLSSKIPLFTPEMLLIPDNSNTSAIEDGKAIILMKSDENYKPEDVKQFSLQLTFYIGDDNEATRISIPIENDHLNYKSAKFDKDLFALEQ